jgi:hypothetical protein
MSTDTALEKREFPERLRVPLRDTLKKYYSGTSLVEAFATDDSPARSTYYRLKSEFPADMTIIEEEARQLALQETDRQVTAFDAELFGVSVGVQRDAAKALGDAVTTLGSIARGATFEAKYMDGDEEKVKTIFTYPRDQIEAMKVLHGIARNGVAPNLAKYKVLAERIAGGGAPSSSRPRSALGVDAHFQSMSAVTKDGQTLTITMDETQEVVLEGEIVEEGTSPPST